MGRVVGVGDAGWCSEMSAWGNARRSAGAFVRTADILGAYRPVGLHEACAHGF